MVIFQFEDLSTRSASRLTQDGQRYNKPLKFRRGILRASVKSKLTIAVQNYEIKKQGRLKKNMVWTQLDLVNIKTDIKSKIFPENTNTNDVPSSYRYPPPRPTPRGYVGVANLNKKIL
ncbi:hypothetical protein M9H77_30570 [Catharanthus roseus]|uniref:Uncharacterized protein n=1 Tax=Catharanthus roseus TaxID=4058 RepID=A0ACB9ZXL5_CATRO|nr:hypothetical protein M9H77_30570 [Catharanthus roseus]